MQGLVDWLESVAVVAMSLEVDLAEVFGAFAGFPLGRGEGSAECGSVGAIEVAR